MHKPFVKILSNKLVALYKIKALSVDNQLKIKNRLLKVKNKPIVKKKHKFMSIFKYILYKQNFK